MLPALFALSTQAQTSSNLAFAITSEQVGQQHWTEVKQVDLSTGNVVNSVFESTGGQYDVYDGRSETKLTLQAGDSATDNKRPFSGQAAACAYDPKSNRLYFAPIFLNQLRYLDLGAKKPSAYIFQNESFSSATDVSVEANQMTRMVIAADGNGYSLNNDGSHLVKFTTGKIPVVTDLGAVIDSPGNDSISVSDPNTSWGGDMVADASGNLYLITAHNNVFKIDLKTRVATFVQKVKGLPAGYTTNGAVVDADGQLVLSSANSVTGYYKVDPSTWESKLLASDKQVYNTSDLANENLLFKTKLPDVKVETSENVSVYPNPVRSNVFKVTFANKTSGDYNVQLVDLAGRTVSDKVVNVYNSGQVADVKISPAMTRGIYFVRVLGNDNKQIYSKKLIVE